MARNNHYHFYYHESTNMSRNRRRSYGLLNFAFDVFMTCITFGFWLIWIFAREMRR